MNHTDNCSIPHCHETHIAGLYLVRSLKTKDAVLTDCPVRLFWGTMFDAPSDIEIYVGEIPVPLRAKDGTVLIERLHKAALARRERA